MIPITTENVSQLQPLQTATRGWIAQLVWSPNGKLLACSSAGGVGIWRGALESKPFFIKGHDGPVKGVAFAPNGTTLATASADTFVKVWDLRAFSPTMTPINIYGDHGDAVEKVVIAGNGAVISCGVDGTVRVFSQLGNRVLAGHTDEVNSLALRYDQAVIISGGRDATVRLWDTSTGEPLATLTGHNDWIRKIASHPRKPVIATASRDATVRLWDIADPVKPEPLAAFRHAGDVRAVAFDASGEVIASGSTDGAIQLWRVADGERLGALEAHTMPVLSLAFHPQNNLLASGGGDNQIRLWGINPDNGV